MLALLLATWTIDALLNLPRFSDPQLRPDGGMYAYVQRGKVYLAPVDAGAEPKLLQAGGSPRWSPDGKSLAFVAASNGVSQVFVWDARAQSIRMVTHSRGAVGLYAWASDGHAVGYVATEGNPPPDPEVSGEFNRYAHLYWQSLEGGTARQLTTAQQHVISFALSPSGKEAVVAVRKSPHGEEAFQSDLFTVDLRTLATKPLVVQPGRDAEPSYSPDGQWVAFHSQGGSSNYFEQRDVAIVPSGGGTIRYLTRGHPEDVFRNGNVFTWSADSRSLIYTAGLGVRDVLVRQDIASGTITTLAEGIGGAASFTPDLHRAVFLKTSRSHPADIVLFQDGVTRELTRAGDAVAKLPEFSSEVVKWKSRDGLEIEGVLWLPPGYRAGQRIPMLTELHGGPTGVTLDSFPLPSVYPVEVFLQNGIAVFSPNYRGSANYGAKFRLKNALSQGEGDYDDVITGVDSLIARGIADPDRLGVMGWSYGGYLTASVVTQTKRFKAASIGAPAVDWITYYGQSDGAREVLWTYFGGTPWEVPENYEKHSPRAHLKDVRTPCLLQVGALDINHNAEIYRALTDNHVEVVYTLYPREGHGFVEPAHIRDVMERNLSWFLARLK